MSQDSTTATPPHLPAVGGSGGSGGQAGESQSMEGEGRTEVAVPDSFRLSVVIPAFNEVRTIRQVIERVRDSGVNCELILVDDGSSDGTRQYLETLRDASDVTVVLHEENRGKGAAVRSGFEHARGDAVIIQDADLEYDPGQYAYLLQPILAGEADVVFGSRFVGSRAQAAGLVHWLANRSLTGLSNLCSGLRVTDMETCYKVFRREVIEQITPRLRERRFGIEPEITARVAAIPGVRVVEVPIRYEARNQAQGKKIGWRDGVRAVWCILRYNWWAD